MTQQHFAADRCWPIEEPTTTTTTTTTTTNTKQGRAMTPQFTVAANGWPAAQAYPAARESAEYRNPAAPEESVPCTPVDIQLRRLADNRAKLIEVVGVLRRDLSPLMTTDTPPAPGVTDNKSAGPECPLTRHLRDLNDGISLTIGDLYSILGQLDLPRAPAPARFGTVLISPHC